MKIRVLVWIIFSIFFLILTPASIFAATIPYTITEGIPGRHAVTGETFLTVDFTVNYQAGKIIYSGQPDGNGNTGVDDAASIIVVHPDGTTSVQ